MEFLAPATAAANSFSRWRTFFLMPARDSVAFARVVAFMVCASRRFCVSTFHRGWGQDRSRSIRAWVRSSVATSLGYHLRSAGMTYHGATSVLVRAKTSA